MHETERARRATLPGLDTSVRCRQLPPDYGNEANSGLSNDRDSVRRMVSQGALV
jgi:hypothetical protein